MADTGRAARRHLALLLQHQAALRQGVPAIAVPDSDQLAMHQRPARPKASMQSSRRWRARRCRRCRSRRASRPRIFPIADPAYSPMARRRPTPTRPPTRSPSSSSATKTISTAASIRPTKACATRWSWRRARRKPIVIADTQDNPGAGGDSDTTGMLRALVAQQRHQRRDRRDLRSRHRRKAAHAAGVGATVTLALGGKSGIPGDAPYEESFIVEKLSDGQFVAPGPYYGGRDMDMGPSACFADRRCQGRRGFAQGAARRSGDVSLCRHRADGAIDPGQQELGAFPRRFRADRREAADLRRARRDAGRHRRPCHGRGCVRASASSRTVRPSFPSQITFPSPATG